MNSSDVLNLVTMLPLLVAERPHSDVGKPFALQFGIPPGRRPAGGDRRIVRRARPRRARSGAARRHRLGQDLYDGACHRPHRAAGDHPRPEQDPGRAALRRDEELLPGQRGRILCLLLRLLPARGLRSAHRHLCRKGIVAERGDRPDAPFGDAGDPGAARRHRRRLGVVHLRHRLGRDLFADDPVPGQGRPGQPHPAAGPIRRIAIPAQRPQFRARRVSRARRHDRAVPGALRGPRLAAVAVRRRDRGDPRDRPADRRKDRGIAIDQGLRQQPLRHAAPDPVAGDRADQARPQDPPRGIVRRGQAAGGAAARTADHLRSRNDRCDRQLRRHRELFALSDRAQAGRAAADLFRIHAARRAGLCRRKPCHGAATGRHVPRRLDAQDDPGRIRVPAAVLHRQPTAQIRGVGGDARPDGVCLGDARAVGDEPRRRRLRRADRAADRPRRPALHHPPGRHPGRRSDGRMPRGGG